MSPVRPNNDTDGDTTAPLLTGLFTAAVTPAPQQWHRILTLPSATTPGRRPPLTTAGR
ncbi:hypothetical protein [Streptomyces sp. 4F14]|uniref:hypothetical protein n=1 Tax=Streptomyces sp. 4F14 TaxID=3394380 RepID=UPI003A835591